jgi:protein-disulfide isomerase
LLVWALFFFIIGGLVGWTLGRQATPSSPQANGPVAVNDNPLAAATIPGSETAVNDSIAPSTGPTPASITSETIKTLGNPDAPVNVVEFSDYQCPFCLRHFDNTMPLLQQYIDAGQLRYVFKDFPIHSIHPQAQKAHKAARCARELGGDDA